MTPPEGWSAEALSLLDTLWGEHASMLVVRRRLHPLLGFYPSPEQVMAMVKRPRPTERFGFAPPMREDNPVRLVAPGTHSKRGFTMLKAKP